MNLVMSFNNLGVQILRLLTYLKEKKRVWIVNITYVYEKEKSRITVSIVNRDSL